MQNNFLTKRKQYLMTRKDYEFLADHWRRRFEDTEDDEATEVEYLFFTDFLHNNTSNFRVSHFDEAVGFERIEEIE